MFFLKLKKPFFENCQQKISSFEEKLSSKQFIRIHKSYLCSIRKIEKIANKSLFVAQYELAIGQSYREKVFKLV